MATVRTAALIAAMTALFLGIGWLIGGQQGAVIAFVVAAAMNGYALWNSDKAVLRQHGAQEIPPGDARGLHEMTRRLAENAGLPMPKLYLLATDQPNAFATGRNPDNAAVAVTAGLLRNLSRDEVEGVIAHELAHIRNRDTLLMTVTATLAGAIAMLANFAMFFGGRRDGPMGIVGVIAMVIVAPIAAGIVQMAVSRTREYEADRVGAKISGDPAGLAGALRKIATLAGRTLNAGAERHPASAHLFIINPLHAHKHDNLFTTHPATENRIARLMEMSGGPGPRSAPPAADPAPWGGRPAPADPQRGPWG